MIHVWITLELKVRNRPTWWEVLRGNDSEFITRRITQPIDLHIEDDGTVTGSDVTFVPGTDHNFEATITDAYPVFDLGDGIYARGKSIRGAPWTVNGKNTFTITDLSFRSVSLGEIQSHAS